MGRAGGDSTAPVPGSFKDGGGEVNRGTLPGRFAGAIRVSMADEKAMQAVGRIERALARIEAAASAPRPAPPRDDSELIELRQTHHALRGKVEGAIAQIDRLLATGERV